MSEAKPYKPTLFFRRPRWWAEATVLRKHKGSLKLYRAQADYPLKGQDSTLNLWCPKLAQLTHNFQIVRFVRYDRLLNTTWEFPSCQLTLLANNQPFSFIPRKVTVKQKLIFNELNQYSPSLCRCRMMSPCSQSCIVVRAIFHPSHIYIWERECYIYSHSYKRETAWAAHCNLRGEVILREWTCPLTFLQSHKKGTPWLCNRTSAADLILT